MEYSTLISLVAVVLSAIAIFISLTEITKNRPTLRINAYAAFITGAKLESVYSISIVNVGRQPTTIETVSFGNKKRFWHKKKDYTHIFPTGFHPSSVTLPVKIEPGEVVKVILNDILPSPFEDNFETLTEILKERGYKACVSNSWDTGSTYHKVVVKK